MTETAEAAEAARLPEFPYHPDPLATGSVVRSGLPCACCGRARGYVYTGPVFAVDDPDGRLCPWCIADGRAAERYEAQFTEVDGEAEVSLAARITVERRTPGYVSWQQPRWPGHCGDAAVHVAGRETGGGAAEYLFRCRVCGERLTTADAD